jgi:Kef-type K+ transport system membrane component KefB
MIHIDSDSFLVVVAASALAALIVALIAPRLAIPVVVVETASAACSPPPGWCCPIAMVLVFGLMALASQLGLDLLLGGFVAGTITRLALQGHEVERFESKLTAVAGR